MAEYYHTAIVPARVRHPQDKFHAEGGIKCASTWILAAFRDRKFFSIAEVKTTVAEKQTLTLNVEYRGIIKDPVQSTQQSIILIEVASPVRGVLVAGEYNIEGVRSWKL